MTKPISKQNRKKRSGRSSRALKDLNRTFNGPMYAMPYIPNDDPPPIQNDWKLTRRIRWRPVLTPQNQFIIREADIANHFPMTGIVNFSWVKIELRGATNSDITLTSAQDNVTVMDSGVVGSRRARVGLKASLLNKAVHPPNGTTILFSGSVASATTETFQTLIDMVVTVLTNNFTFSGDNNMADDYITLPPESISSASSLANQFRRRLN